MRIISGKNRGRRLFEPKGFEIRPTTDRTKESLFNIINYYIEGSTFLDLFAGSGSVSFEADSRGASKVVSVDMSKESKRCYQKNNEKIPNDIEFIQSDVRKYLNYSSIEFDYIFMDPPYEIEEEELFEIIDLAKNRLSEDGQLILEMSSQRRLNIENLTEKRKYGKATLYFINNEK